MNNRGGIMLAVLFSIFIFMMGIVFINFLKPDVTTARQALSCSDSANISDGTKLTCLFVDTIVLYWIALIISVAGGVIFDRLLV